ncbi:UBX domain-containing protein 11 isoform X2 [Sardina pilchardus]|uniref:UBX domain-containing protein 11 isoform X2 n=1 Tax=Sardina pilchardus TaxID=27697 RepID=UPI002E13D6D7
MSSPLSLLGKNRRAPLPGSLDEGRKRVPFKQSSSIDRTPTDFELMSTMMQKLAQLEIRVKAQALDIQRKEKTIAVLEEKLTFEKKSKEQNCEQELVEKCHKLQKQVWEMEQFLADYGMIWIGSNGDVCADERSSDMDDVDKHTKQGLWEPATSRTGEFRMNFDLVLANIRELNVLAGEGESYVKVVPGGAQLAQRTAIPLQLYSNGIVMFSGPFRSYDEPSTQLCMQDLADGYFPSELQERFPDGVPFQVQDRREEVYKDRREQKDFPGKGRLVCGASSETSAQSPATSTQATSCASGKAASTEQFLKRLPKTVIKAGKVIDIRDSLRNHLKSSAVEDQHPSVIIVDTPALQTSQERLDQPDGTACDADGDISTLRVKSENGEKTFVLKMNVTQTVGDLRQYLDKYRCSGSSPYNIISVFPRRRYDDDSQTLAACGLTPSAALLLQPY